MIAGNIQIITSTPTTMHIVRIHSHIYSCMVAKMYIKDTAQSPMCGGWSGTVIACPTSSSPSSPFALAQCTALDTTYPVVWGEGKASEKHVMTLCSGCGSSVVLAHPFVPTSSPQKMVC